MSLLYHLRLLADYNQWMNDKLYRAAAGLPAAELTAERGAFFGSLQGTLNHLLVADTIWLQRFRAHPRDFATLAPLAETAMPQRLDQPLCADFAAMRTRRAALDATMVALLDEVSEDDLNQPLAYRNMQGVAAQRVFGSVLLHVFNHQTHHRGQATALLSQAGVDVGVTDLLLRIPDQLAQ
ncbi:DinB family protein [Vogesella sp. GCM10023246]|uniref:DinB family protein n=1 Tax=Vogesella oryzagri TaxID=3160864 RepID=A0ABV1M0K3_9NEIS